MSTHQSGLLYSFDMIKCTITINLAYSTHLIRHNHQIYQNCVTQSSLHASQLYDASSSPAFSFHQQTMKPMKPCQDMTKATKSREERKMTMAAGKAVNPKPSLHLEPHKFSHV